MNAQKIQNKLIGLMIFLGCSLSIGQDAPVDTAKSTTFKPKVHLIYMGGNDCPPCVAWRQFELPKLQKTLSFQAIEFDYVTKLIRSPVPASFFLPQAVKPYKDLLDTASGRAGGSPQFALLVDGRIHDYYFGTRDANVTEQMLQAALTGSPYPVPKRCLQLSSHNPRMCIVEAP